VTLKAHQLHQQREYGLVLEEGLEEENSNRLYGDINSQKQTIDRMVTPRIF
jgi:hypothetical protein